MEVTITEAIDVNKRTASVKKNQKLVELERKKKLIDEQVKELQQQLIDKLEGLMKDAGPNPDRKRKIIFLSCFASIFSLSVGFLKKFAGTPGRISWSYVIGGGAVAYSLYCLKSVSFTIQEQAKEQTKRAFLLKLAVEAVTAMPRKYALEARFKPCLDLGMPADLFAAMLKEESDETDLESY